MKDMLLTVLPGDMLDSLYHDWKESPVSVPPEWRLFFTGFEFGQAATIPNGPDDSAAAKLSGVQSLIYRYRSLGHLQACTDPLSPCKLSHPLLELTSFGLDESDLTALFDCRRFIKSPASLQEIVETVRETYCRELGVEFMHIQDPDERQWLIDKMESSRNRTEFSVTEQLHILEKLQQANSFETYLHRKFVGQKRFSLEGGEVLIPSLDRVVANSPRYGITDIVMGMSHRGRLNVLAHILGKPYEAIFSEFRENGIPGFSGDGDVKYHKGHSADIACGDGSVHITMAANPSHLEAVNAVVEGKCRARQDRYGVDGALRVLPLLIHGDAAFAGQGSVTEVLNMSGLDGYSTGGTLHIILNNQIGFTTLPKDARSTSYATDVAKMLACPIFHVQGEAPEAALHAIDLAMEYRRNFHRDVVIEFICYRRHGHNEGDEPAFTQPGMYRQIASRPTVNSIYASFLMDEAGVTEKQCHEIELRVTASLEESFLKQPDGKNVGYADRWNAVTSGYSPYPVETAVESEKILTLSRRLALLPADITPHPKISALIQRRFEAVLKGEGIDWGNAETLAYATLLDEGYSVRLSGQDSRRGTFNHRHSVVVDTHDDRNYIPLEAIAGEKATFQVWNSLLSEFGVLGFEYGYSLELPDCLTIWEAQFGDFANGAQVIIDQFIASGETKWNRASGLVLLLPHGYEGQGAEHSSARIERYLQLCATENMVVVYPSTPAQMFHLLRRQLLQPFRKPLVVFTPKSLLRNPGCSSSLGELSAGNFMAYLVTAPDTGDTRRVLFCTGKIYFELAEERERLQCIDTAIVRVEQLYPLDWNGLQRVLERFDESCIFRWVQEEPENMGAWQHMERCFRELSIPIGYVGRAADACAAVGSHNTHAEQQKDLVSRAFSN